MNDHRQTALADGGPAFPGGYMVDQKDRGPVVIFAPGMSLRDYAAIHADMSQMRFGSTAEAAEFMGEPIPTDLAGAIRLSARAVARLRYEFADAMLKARMLEHEANGGSHG